ncbi:MAG: hypothetical protein FJX65_11125 [Alphaproteobacteria bacterium]|nr:hypothetical protein [Alphaproteobacteria bacterium]
MDHVFSDGVADTSFVNGLIRIDFFRFSQGSEGEGDKKRPRREFSHRLVLSRDAYLQMQQAMAQMTQRLIDRGIMKRNDPAAKKAEKDAKAEAKPAKK